MVFGLCRLPYYLFGYPNNLEVSVVKKALALILGLVIAINGVPAASLATQTITFTQAGTIPAPYNAYDSSWCAWRSGANVDSNADGSRIIVADGKFYNCGGPAVSRYIYLSTDGGATFTAASGLPSAPWGVVASSPTGQYLAAGAHQGNLYVSRDYGATWSIATTPGVKPWWDVKMSNDGSFMMATYDYSSVPYVSYDYGVTWATLTGFTSGAWRDIAVSGDGKVVAICQNDGNANNDGARIYVSRSGAVPSNFSSFTETIDRPANTICGSLEMDAAGTRLAALTWSNDSVAIWSYSSSAWSVVRQFTETWTDGYNGISMSADGQTIFMPGWDQKPDYISFDGGVTSQYITVTDLPTRIGVATVSRDGSKLIEIGSDRVYVASLGGASNSAQQQQQQVVQPLHKIIGLAGRSATQGQASTLGLIGEGLQGATSATLGAKTISISKNTASLIEFSIPADLALGTHDLKIRTPNFVLTFSDAVVVSAVVPAKPKVSSITCLKGSKVIKVSAVAPKCPVGFKKR
jgi:hypothetical protein